MHRADCVWADIVETCHSKNERVPCNKAMDPIECKAIDCDWHDIQVEKHIPGLCTAVGTKPACSEFTSIDKAEKVCGMAGHCEWDDRHSVCLDPGTRPKCGQVYDEALCRKEPHCQFDAVDYMCLGVDELRVCEHVYDQEQCATHVHCEFLPGLNICHRVGIKIGCYRMEDQSLCKAHGAEHCEWIRERTVCSPIHEPKPCEFYGNPRSCGDSTLCEWDAKGDFCKLQGLKVMCGRWSESACRTEKGCIWSHDACVSAADSRQTCKDVPTPRKCDRREHQCAWNKEEKQCLKKAKESGSHNELEDMSDTPSIDPPSIDPPSIDPPSIDPPSSDKPSTGVRTCNGKPDADRCTSTGGVRTCNGKPDPDSCGTKFRNKCNDEDLGDLVRTACPLMCSTCPQDQLKDTAGRTTFRNKCNDEDLGDLVRAACPIMCGTCPQDQLDDNIDAATDADVITPNVAGHDTHHRDEEETLDLLPEHQESLAPDCSSKVCLSAPPSCLKDEVLIRPLLECCPRCGFEDDACSSFYEQEQCPDKCEWHSVHGFCGGLGVPVPCNKLITKQRCLNEEIRAGQCDWHESVSTCTPKNSQISCAKFFTADTCPDSRCTWHDHLAQCWDQSAVLPCDHFYNQQTCPLERCDFDESVGLCVDPNARVECDGYHDEEACAQRSDNCHWHSHSSRCLSKGEDIPCEAHGIDECSTYRGCTWDEKLGFCGPAHDFEPLACKEHFNKNSCTGDGCSWNSKSDLCHKVGDKLPCTNFYDVGGCTENGHCQWNSDAHQCHKLVSIVFLLQF